MSRLILPAAGTTLEPQRGVAPPRHSCGYTCPARLALQPASGAINRQFRRDTTLVRQSPFTAVYNACVLYPAVLRDFLMWLALSSGRFRARWSAQIHAEWKRSLLRKRSDLSAAQLDRISDLMDRAIPDALVTGHEKRIAGLQLPDPGDRHVLAAAIHCGASVIVSFNRKDFPASALTRLRMQAQHPDDFVQNLFDLDRAAVIGAAQRQRALLGTCSRSRREPRKCPFADGMQGAVRSP